MGLMLLWMFYECFGIDVDLFVCLMLFWCLTFTYLLWCMVVIIVGYLC